MCFLQNAYGRIGLVGLLREIKKMSEPRRIGQLAIFIFSTEEFCSSRAAKKKGSLRVEGGKPYSSHFSIPSVVLFFFPSLSSLPSSVFSVLFESHLHKTIEGERGHQSR